MIHLEVSVHRSKSEQRLFSSPSMLRVSPTQMCVASSRWRAVSLRPKRGGAGFLGSLLTLIFSFSPLTCGEMSEMRCGEMSEMLSETMSEDRPALGAAAATSCWLDAAASCVGHISCTVVPRRVSPQPAPPTLYDFLFCYSCSVTPAQKHATKHPTSSSHSHTPRSTTF